MVRSSRIRSTSESRSSSAVRSSNDPASLTTADATTLNTHGNTQTADLVGTVTKVGKIGAAGVSYDVRKDEPYCGYESYDFDVPVGDGADAYTRYRLRLEEMRDD